MDGASLNEDQSVEFGIPGYTLSEDLLLEPDRDSTGEIINPNLKFPTKRLCEKCSPIIKKAEAQFVTLALETASATESSLLGSTLTNMPFWTAETEILESARRCCHLCAVLLAHPVSELHNENACVPGTITLNMFWAPRDFPSTNDGLALWAVSHRHTCGGVYKRYQVEFMIQHRTKPRSADQPATLDASNFSQLSSVLASSWLSSCQEHHSECRARQALVTGSRMRRVPKRLLDVGNISNTQQEGQVIVRNTFSDGIRIPEYLTVSHCWGKNDTNTSLTTIEGNLKTEYNVKELPQLVRDCVDITRRLGYRYLWIDTFCIIQNDEQDKKEEVEKMGDIYAGSICNIEASDARDSHDSLFTKYLALSTSSTSFRTLDFGHHGQFDLTIESPRGDHHVGLPLYRRGWVIQEVLLAPRTLEYTKHGIRWRCKEATLGNTLLGDTKHLYSPWKFLLALQVGKLTETEKLRGSHSWTDIIERYGRSNFTFEEDRDIALLGVVNFLQDHVGLSMWCGIWVDFLPYSLLYIAGLRAERQLTRSWSCSFTSKTYRNNYLSLLDEDTSPASCSLDKSTSVILVTAIHITVEFRNASATQRPVYREIMAECWNRYDIRFEMDYEDLGPLIVDLVVLVKQKYCSAGLVLAEVSEKYGTWKRLGYFQLESLGADLTNSWKEKEYRIL